MKLHLLIILLTSLFISCSSLEQKKNPLSSHEDIKIAVVNFRVDGGASFDKHIQRIEVLASAASAKDAHYLLLPELTVFDLLPVEPGKEEIYNELQKLAKLAPQYENALVEIGMRHKINLIGASLVVKKKDKFINRALFISAKGIVKYQDKIEPTPWEKDYKFIGGKKVQVFTTDDFSFVILVCHDAEFPSISNSLGRIDPEVIFVPSMTDDDFGLKRVRITSAARAIEHMSYVFMTGISGNPEAPWHSYFGQNHFFGPQNKYFKGLDTSVSGMDESMSIYQINLKRLRQARKDATQVYPYRDIQSRER